MPEESHEEHSLKTLSPQPTLAVRLHCAPMGMEREVPRAIARVTAAVASLGANAAGVPCTGYLSHEPDRGRFHLEVGIPVSTPQTGAEEVEASVLPGGTALSLWHVGPYHGLGRAFQTLYQMVSNRGLASSGPPWESYVVGPSTEPDASK